MIDLSLSFSKLKPKEFYDEILVFASRSLDKSIYLSCLFYSLITFFINSINAQSTPGDIVIVGFNADGSDGFAFLTMVEIAPNRTIYFTDKEWSGQQIGIGSFNSSEGIISWSNTESCFLPSGTIVTIIDASNNPTASWGTAIESDAGFNMNSSNEVLYAYIGANQDTPSAFLCALATDDFTYGTIMNTGLVVDDTAIEIDNLGVADEDVGVYIGTTICNGTMTACRLMITDATNNGANWLTEDGSGDQSQNGSSAEFPSPNGSGTGLPSNFSGSLFPGSVCSSSTLTAKDTMICALEPVNLENLLLATPNGALEYGVAFGNYPDTITTTVQPATTTTYYIRDSIYGSCCADTTRLTVTVKTTPFIQGIKDTICIGETINLEDFLIGSLIGTVEYGTAFGQFTDTITTLVSPTTDITYFIRDSLLLTECADTAMVMIKVDRNVTRSETYDGCVGDGYTVVVNGNTYDESMPTGTETFVGGAANGCDSVVTIMLTFKTNATGIETYNGCQGDGYSVMVNGNTYDESMPTGSEIFAGAAANGCDSVVTINLNFKPAPSSGTAPVITLCLGDGTSTEIIPDGGGFPPSLGSAFNVTWDFEGETFTPVSNNAMVTEQDAITGPDLGTISFPSGNGSTDALSSSGWNDEAGDYFEFCVKANGSDLQITGFAFTDRASGSGPTDYSVFSSDDNFSSVLTTGTTHDPFNTTPESVTNLTFAIMSGDSICFRL